MLGVFNSTLCVVLPVYYVEGLLTPLKKKTKIRFGRNNGVEALDFGGCVAKELELNCVQTLHR